MNTGSSIWVAAIVALALLVAAIVVVLRRQRAAADAAYQKRMREMIPSVTGSKEYYEAAIGQADPEIGHVHVALNPRSRTVRVVIRRRDGGFVSLATLAKAQRVAGEVAPTYVRITVETA